MSRGIFAHSRWDAAMVAVTLFEIGLTAYGTLSWGALPLFGSVLLAGACIVANCLNYQCVAHSFIHFPFFASRLHNRIFSVVNSVSLIGPQSLYRVHHLEHHRFNNDRPDAVTGRPGDSSSTYRYSRQAGREEHILAYSFLGPFRVEYAHLYAGSRKHGDAALTWAETAAMVVCITLLGALNWRGLLFFFVPVWYLGQAFSLAHNYAEHHGAKPGNRLADAVSCYGRVYNLLWFNEGYHQEHHYRPQVHWTKLPALRRLMLPETERRVVPIAHWVNFFGPSASGGAQGGDGAAFGAHVSSSRNSNP